MEELTGNINKYSVSEMYKKGGYVNQKIQIDCDSKNCSQYVFLRIYECIETIEQTMVQGKINNFKHRKNLWPKLFSHLF